MASEFHEAIVQTISRSFTDSRQDLSVPTQARIATRANSSFNDFEGRYGKSRKVPDLAIVWNNGSFEYEPKFILEVGFTETYNELVKDARLWLEDHSDVSAVIVVKLDETPSFQCPSNSMEDAEIEAIGFPVACAILSRNFKLQGSNGPVRYRGLQWTGRLTAFLEVWRRHPVSGLAARSGNRVVGY